MEKSNFLYENEAERKTTFMLQLYSKTFYANTDLQNT